DRAQRAGRGERVWADRGGGHRLGGASGRLLRRDPALWFLRPSPAARRRFRKRGIGPLRGRTKSFTIPLWTVGQAAEQPAGGMQHEKATCAAACPRARSGWEESQ